MRSVTVRAFALLLVDLSLFPFRALPKNLKNTSYLVFNTMRDSMEKRRLCVLAKGTLEIHFYVVDRANYCHRGRPV